MSTKLVVGIRTSGDVLGSVSDHFEIVTKTEIFKIGVFAKIMKLEEYEDLDKQSFKLNNRPLKKPNVIEITHKIKTSDALREKQEEPIQATNRSQESYGRG